MSKETEKAIEQTDSNQNPFVQSFDGLVIDLESEVVEISGNNLAFEGTPFYKKDFIVFVKPLTHGEFERLKRKFVNPRNNTINDSAFTKELFMMQVQDWNGLQDPNGNSIPCTKEIKEQVGNKLFFFVKAVNLACLNARMEMVEAEEKN